MTGDFNPGNVERIAQDARRIHGLVADNVRHQGAVLALTGRVAELEAGLQLIGNELSLHADPGPAGVMFRGLLNSTLGSEGKA